MKDFLFIYGKNPDISLAEIVSYFEAGEMDFQIKDYSDIFVLIGMQNLPKNMMEDLGGTIKIAEVLLSTGKKDVSEIMKEAEQKIDFDKLFRILPEKTTFGVSSYNSRKEHELFSDFFKSKMKEKGIKAGYMHLPSNISVVPHADLVKKHIVEKSLEIITCTGKNFYLGKTLFVHNPFEFQKRDVKRPVQRAIYSIPPRLSKIMINLSGSKSGVLLDPFCGIGSILQEAALMGFDVRGVDIDKDCVEGCVKNLSWLEKEYKIKIGDIGKKIMSGDSRNLEKYFSENSVDAIVTEPYLGPPLKEKPSAKEGKSILDEIAPLYERSLENMIKVLKPGKRIVIVAPVFKTEEGIVRLDMDEICRKNNCVLIDVLKKYGIPHGFPFLDFEDRHKTIREINVVEKNG